MVARENVYSIQVYFHRYSLQLLFVACNSHVLKTICMSDPALTPLLESFRGPQLLQLCQRWESNLV